MEGALAYLENDGMLSLSHLDDICLDLGMAPDEHGEVRAPAWLYEGVLRDLAGTDRPETASSPTKCWRTPPRASAGGMTQGLRRAGRMW